MRIGLMIPGSLHQRSGGYLFDRLMVERLERSGHQVEVLSLPSRGYLGSLLRNRPEILERSLRGDDYDVLLQDELAHPTLLGVNRRLRRAADTTPLVGIVHHLRCSEPRTGWMNALYRRVEAGYMATLDAAICTSHVTAQTVSEIAREPLPSVVSHPGRDHLDIPDLSEGAIRARAEEAGPLRLVFLGNLIRRKGLETLLSALQGLPDRSWHLTVIGSPDLEPGYARRMVRILRLKSNVRWLGGLPHEELGQHLASMHLLAMPSGHEGFGIAYLEGMGYGLPALASASGGARDLVADRVNGYLIPPGGVELLKERLRSLAEDRHLLAQMGLAARARFEQHPTWDESIGVIDSFLTEVIRGPGPGSSRPVVPFPHSRGETMEEVT